MILKSEECSGARGGRRQCSRRQCSRRQCKGCTFSPLAERLEGRLLLATFTVTSTADSGNGSLRQAILNSNATVGVLDTITFSIGAGTRTIMPNSAAAGALPNITDPVIIDATAPAAFPTQVIELNGASTPAGSNGLKVTAGGSTLRALTVNRFPANGIELSTRGNNVIEGCRIGTDVAGAVDLGNGGDGIALNASGTNRIGGTSAAQRNVISGNTSDGVELSAGSNGNTIQGNYIGLQAGGAAALPNSATGVRIDNSSGNTIGGVVAGSRNVISGNAGDGVRLFGAAAQNNLVQGNYIGTNAAGTAAVRNGSGSGGGNGVTILSASNNTVGSPTVAAAGNVISGNADNGVEIAGGAAGAASNNAVQGNFIGTNAAGNAAVGNQNDGVMISGPPLLTPGAGPASDNTIGGPGSASRNVISGNADDGIEINGPAATGNFVRGNYIGTDVSGALALGNTSDGVEIEGGVMNVVGGAGASGEVRNVISANASDGVEIWAGPTGATGVPSDNAVQGNYIGTAADGAAALGNAKFGVNLVAGMSNRIGGDEAAAGNVIAFNGRGADEGAGVFVEPAAARNPIRRNSIFSNNPGALGSGLGIDLAPLGVTANDAGDVDSGANSLQNYPDLSSARVFTAGGTLTLRGNLSSTPSSTFAVDFYASPAGSADPSGFGEGKTFLGSVPVTTDAAGRATFDVTLTAAVPAGSVISSTATSSANDTSEFSRTVTTSEGPAVTAAAYVYQTTPNSLMFTFSSDVGASLNPEDVSAQNLNTGATITPASVTYNAGSNTATFTFSGRLPDGNYRATLSAAGVTSPGGTPLAEDYVLDFFVLAGDINRDRAVNGTDFAILAGSFGKSGLTYPQGDLNGDGAVNGSDFAILAGNFGKTVPAPAFLAAKAVATAQSPVRAAEAIPGRARLAPVRRRQLRFRLS